MCARTELNAALAGEIALGPHTANRLGFGAMRITGPGIWGEPKDPRVPYEESLGTLVDLQREGKIGSIGISNVTAPQLERALEQTAIVSVQNRYSVGDRASDDVVTICEREGLAFLPWFPLGAGRLARNADPSSGGATGTPAQLAIEWLLERSPMMLPIPGTSSVAHLEENLGAAALAAAAGAGEARA